MPGTFGSSRAAGRSAGGADAKSGLLRVPGLWLDLGRLVNVFFGGSWVLNDWLVWNVWNMDFVVSCFSIDWEWKNHPNIPIDSYFSDGLKTPNR